MISKLFYVKTVINPNFVFYRANRSNSFWAAFPFGPINVVEANKLFHKYKIPAWEAQIALQEVALQEVADDGGIPVQSNGKRVKVSSKSVAVVRTSGRSKNLGKI